MPEAPVKVEAALPNPVEVAEAARVGAVRSAALDNDVRDRVLTGLAARIRANADRILAANAEDMRAAREAGLGAAKLQRLELTPEKIEATARGVEVVVDLPAPVGAVTRDSVLENGLKVQKVRAPLGAILMIYEARPHVTVDAFALCFKAGNACLLKGGREANESNTVLEAIIHEELREHGIDPGVVQLVTTSDRNFIRELLKQEDRLDLVIPRGGERLIRFVHEHSRIPTVLHFEGVCHVYVDESADVSMARDVILNGKLSAPATCNATEAVLVHEAVAEVIVPVLVTALVEAGVEVRGDEAVCALAEAAVPATAADWGTEFLDLILAMKVVPDAEAAMDHIETYGSRHTEAVVAEDVAVQEAFVQRSGASCTMVNASTRFNDGGQLGLGAEIGISTTRVHAFGPMGLEELTTQRWVVRGSGQTRG
ncbi:MAG TPA: glutamate-5-semialdehyde dehydrogenase [Longimicrobiales bacterium]|nr:glutamate-5-semialdehyde dehydrogenase [Longimicrobiales bacterium]